MANKGTNVRTVAGEVALQYVADNPDMASRTLARKLRHEQPELFTSIDRARSMVRTLRGNNGKKRRGDATVKDHFRPNGKAGDIVFPKGIVEFKEPVQIDGPIKLLIVSDSHVPFHDENALEAALRKGIESGCNGVYFNGDTLDCYAWSSWAKDPRKRNFRHEIDTAIEVLSIFAPHFERKWYKLGNHEERYQRALNEREADLVGFEQFELRSLLKLDEMGYEFVDGRQWAEAGLLPILHGHEFGRGLAAPVNPARGLWNRTFSTGIVGHLHRPSSNTQKQSIQGNIITGWSLGCTCQLRPLYAPLNQWIHGFAVVDIAANGEYEVSNYQMDEGKVFRA